MSATDRVIQACGTCSHWDKTWGRARHSAEGHRGSIEQYRDGEMRPLPGEWGDCQRILHLGTGGGRGAPFVDSGAEVTVAAFLSDGSGYYASLSTRSDFGCTLWEARP